MVKVVGRSNKTWILILVGIVFLAAAVYRIFNYSIGIQEFNELGLPVFLLPFTILLELVLASLFILRKKVVFAAIVSIIFLSMAIVSAFIFKFSSILSSFTDIFVFKANSVDILLHMMYVVLLVIILIDNKNSK